MAFPRPLPPKVKHPMLTRREPPKGFLGTNEGKRVIMMMVMLVAVVGSVFGNKILHRQDATPASGPTSQLSLRHLPAEFLSADTKHLLIAAEDGAQKPLEPGLIAILRAFNERMELAKNVNPKSRPPEPKLVDLNITEALAAPDKFRGGWVRFQGIPSTAWTVDLANAVAPKGVYYTGILVEDPRSTGVMFGTTERLPDFERARCRLEIEGVFLQNVRFETQSLRPSERYRTVPFVVARSVRIFEEKPQKTWMDQLFLPVIVGLVFVTAVATYLVVKQVDKRRSISGYRIRPGGPMRSKSNGQ